MTSATRTDAPGADAARGADRIDPTRAAAGAARWRKALAEALGEDPGARLDRPDRLLPMLRVFGSTRRLADLCLKHPAAAADALVEGASHVVAEAARDLAALAAGVGGADQLYGALAPLKNRVDIAVGLAELSGAWTAREATAARTDFAERLVDTALSWLVRGAVNRGELAAAQEDGPAPGVFALAGGDFAHEDIAPYGPIELVILYDEKTVAGAAARMAERAFVRIGAELREAFEGRPGDYPIFSLKTPVGSAVNGAGLVESQGRIAASFAAPAERPLRAWMATARVVAGDRRAGGAFLEAHEEIIWNGLAALDEETRARLRRESEDPRAPFRAIADLIRWSLGGPRPVFRVASAHEVFALAAASGALEGDVAARLDAGGEFAQMLVARAQMMKGAAAFGAANPDEETALANLCGFTGAAGLRATLGGVIADARNALTRLTDPPLAEFERYRPSGPAAPDDVDKLEDLGFHDGAGLSGVIDRWASLATADATRFASVAPGLLTAFGETQHPDAAARLFDRLICNAPERAEILGRFGETNPARDGLVAALGCFDGAVEPLTRSPASARAFLEDRGPETPRSGAEWVSRHAPPAPGAGIEDIAAWRGDSIARIALCAAAGAMPFDAAASSLESVCNSALAQTMSSLAVKSKGAEGLALHVFDGPGRGLPGAPTPFGFIAAKGGDPIAQEAFARAFVEAVDGLGEGFLAMTPDVSHRPGGAAGGLAPDVAAFKAYIQSEAIAYDQILLARARVIAGREEAVRAAKAALRSAVANPRRADILFRDLDRARAQRLRRDRAGSEWDLDQCEGGLHDVELIISTLIYRHAAAQPAVQEASVDEGLDTLVRAGLLQPGVAETLKSARAFWLRVATARALARWSDPGREPVRPRLAALLARAAEVDRFAQVRPIMRGYAEEVSRLYAQLVLGRPSLSLVANG